MSAFNSPCPLVIVDAHRSKGSLTSEVFAEPSHFLGEERKADSETALSSVVLLLLALALNLREYLVLMADFMPLYVSCDAINSTLSLLQLR